MADAAEVLDGFPVTIRSLPPTPLSTLSGMFAADCHKIRTDKKGNPCILPNHAFS